MPEIIQCPECRRQLRVPDELPDNLVRCPSCAHEFVVNRTQDGGVAIVTTPSKSSPKPVPVLTPVDDDDEPPKAEDRRRRENATAGAGIPTIVVGGVAGPGRKTVRVVGSTRARPETGD